MLLNSCQDLIQKSKAPARCDPNLPSGGSEGITLAFHCARRISILGSVFTTLLAFAAPAFSQQITYYDFDAPQAGNNASYACVDPAHSVVVTPNPLFCFNDGTGQQSSPSFLSDTYPAKIDPVTTDNPPVPSTHFEIQNTQFGR